MATKTQEKPEAGNLADLRSQLHEVKERASNLNAELERANREVKKISTERDDALALKEKNAALTAENKQLRADLAAAENARQSAESYALSNEGEARKLQQIRDAIK